MNAYTQTTSSATSGADRPRTDAEEAEEAEGRPSGTPGAPGTLRRLGAHWPRIAGAGALCALAVLELAWIIRDFWRATEVSDVWWMWTGLLFRAEDGVWATSFLDPTLLVLYVVCGALVLARSTATAGILASAGGLTLLLRTPILWNLHAGWVVGGVTDGLRTKAMLSTVAMLVLGAAMVAAGVVGHWRERGAVPAAGRGLERGPEPYASEAGDAGDAGETGETGRKTGDKVGRTADSGTDSAAGSGSGSAGDGAIHSPGVPAASADGAAEEAPRPTASGARTAALALTAMAALLVVGEVSVWSTEGAELYAHHLTGNRVVATLLPAPAGWCDWSLALAGLAAAAMAVRRGRYARELGMTISGPLLGLGLSSTAFAVRARAFEHFGMLGLREQLRLAGSGFEIVAAVAVILVLAPHATARARG